MIDFEILIGNKDLCKLGYVLALQLSDNELIFAHEAQTVENAGIEQDLEYYLYYKDYDDDENDEDQFE